MPSGTGYRASASHGGGRNTPCDAGRRAAVRATPPEAQLDRRGVQVDTGTLTRELGVRATGRACKFAMVATRRVLFYSGSGAF